MKTKIDYKKLAEIAVVFLCTVAIVLLAGRIIENLVDKIDIPTNLILFISEVVIVIPTVIYCIVKKLNLREDLGFRRIKVSTFFLSILLGFLVMPIASFVNILTQFFVPNIMVQASDKLIEGSTLIMVLITGFLAPLCEEYVFRGLIHRKASKYSTPAMGMIISAVFFGIIHLNINQLCYAIVLGLLFALANNCSRSIYSSVIMHCTVNTINILMLVMASMVYSTAGGNLAESAEQIRGNAQNLISIAIGYFIAGAIAFGIMIPCFKAIKKIESPIVEAAEEVVEVEE